ncbi:Pkinase-domain-containing protein [Auriscalpium vulgare]|uniref:Pkinase-domain-containing protein n=1 Tax=Auriscalpium vulgare TaxID=40419 RepID=A0ACB8SBB9_9AGAM|nr:Pkinase-domain-containing protein [Auriscalpium vulgare]
MAPSATKRPASSPPGDGERSRKMRKSSSPEEGEVDDSQGSPSYRPSSPPRLPPKPELKVKFPFKKKLGGEGGEVRGPPRPEERNREGDRWREADARPTPPGPSRDDRGRNGHSYVGGRSPIRDYRDRERQPERRPMSPPRRHGQERNGRGRSPVSSGSRRTSSSGSRSPSRRQKHRLPPARSERDSLTPPRNRRDRSYESDQRKPYHNGYARGGNDPVNNWGSRDTRGNYRREPPRDAPDRYYRPRTPRSYTPDYASPRHFDPPSPRSYFDRRGDTYIPEYKDDRPRRREADEYRPLSPGPSSLPPRPRSSSPRSSSPRPRLTSPRPPPRSPSTPPPRHGGLPARPPSPLGDMRMEPAPAPKEVHSPAPLPLPPARTVVAESDSQFSQPSEKPSKPQRQWPFRTREEEKEVYGHIFVGSGLKSDYDATTKLGEGTFGEVHKAKHLPTGNAVALKRILMHNEKEGMPVTALREIKILKALDHPNVVELLDMFVVRSKGKDRPLSVYMVFPYMDHDLAGLLENERVKLSPSQIKLYMKQLLEGTEYMHQNHILHRDMKAANLLISNNGSLRIADFGLARSFDPSAASISESATDGRSKERRYTNCVVTRWYRPPELLLGARHYGGEIDLWGVGCVLGEMFLRHPILPGTSDLDQLEKIWQMCGTPNQHTWPNFDTLPGCEGVKHHNQYSKRLKSIFEPFGAETYDLIDKLLTCNPRDRITASQALEHDYFWTDPLPADPKTLPVYEASHEFDKRGRRQQPRPPVIPPPQQPESFRPMPPPAFMANPPPLRFGHGPPPRESFYQPPLPQPAYPQQLPPISFSHGAPPRSGYAPSTSSYPPSSNSGYPPSFSSGLPPSQSFPPSDHSSRPPYGGPPSRQGHGPPRHSHQNHGPPPPSWGSKGPDRPPFLPPKPLVPLGSNGGGLSNGPRRGGREGGSASGGGLNYG